MKYAIATYYTPNIKELVKPLSDSKHEYCQRWKYDFFLTVDNPSLLIYQDNPKGLGFYKIAYIYDILYRHPEIETLCWMDNDAFITNHTISFDNLLQQMNNFDLLIGEDWNGINIGVFFIKNNTQCLNFLQTVYNFIPHPWDSRPYWWVCSEQYAMYHLMSTINTTLVHHSLFNGYIIGPRKDNDWRNYGLGPLTKNWTEKKWQIGDFALHFAGIHNEDKPLLIQEYLQKVIK